MYELAYLLRLGETEAVIEAALKDAGVTVTLKSPINQITLAYPIAKQNSALFGFYQMTMPSGEAIKMVTDALRRKEGILRFLMVKLPKVKPAPVRVLPRVAPIVMPAVANIDSLSNEKLEETLEEILK